MSCMSQYETIILPSLSAAITEAVATRMTEGLKNAIHKKAQDVVYSSASGYARGILGTDAYLYAYPSGWQVVVHSTAPMQGTNYGVSETTFVEAGMANYHMPGARPFMNEGRDEYADGQAKDDLAAVLTAHGFTVI